MRKKNQWNNRWKQIIALATASMLILAGCGTQSQESSQGVDTLIEVENGSATESVENESAETGTNVVSGSAQNSGESMVDLDTSDQFTDRDLSGDYEEDDCEIIQLSEDSVTITKEGTYILSGTLSDGAIIVDVDKSAKVQLVLKGVEITNSKGAAIYVKQADKVFVTLADGTNNVLVSTGEAVTIDENTIDATIFSKEDLTINGTGSLKVVSAKGHGIVSKDDLVITGGTIQVEAASKGLNGNDSVRIADGNLTITSGTDGIHAGNGEDTEKGYVYIESGTIEISAGDDGIHADNILLIAGGIITISESYEGLEGLAIEIQDGDIHLVAKDDGLNAAGGNDQSGGWNTMFASQDGVLIHIAGGTLSVNAAGDGIDSNGNLYVSGGTTYVSGPEDNGNGPLDYNGTATITGGTVVAVGSSGMAQNFGSESTQGSILVNLNSDGKAGTEVKLLDASENVLAQYTADKTFRSVVISCPDLEVGNSYTLQVGEETQEITLDSLIYGNTSMGGMKGPGGFGGREGNGDMGNSERPDGFGGQHESDGERPEMPQGKM